MPPEVAPSTLSIPQVGQSAPAPAASSGFGGWLGAIGNLAQTGFGIYSQHEATRRARKAEELAATREYELERERLELGYDPSPPPLGPTQRLLNQVPLAPGVPPYLLIGGLAVLGVALFMRRS